jgi:hypothetical protein
LSFSAGTRGIATKDFRAHEVGDRLLNGIFIDEEKQIAIRNNLSIASAGSNEAMTVIHFIRPTEMILREPAAK